MVSRRKHTKTRTGCRNCKRRKVKCGEEEPACRNCVRRGETCELVRPSSVPGAATGPTPEVVVEASNGSNGRSPGFSIPPPASTKVHGTSPASSRGQGQYDAQVIASGTLTVIDLELLHHYCISTASTLTSDPVVRTWFLEDVPHIAFSHAYVLHALLALAATHLAHFRPEDRQTYYARAKAHHTKATALATPLLSQITDANQIPMYCFSVFTLLISFGSLRDPEGFHSDATDALPGWLPLFRGVRTVLEANDRAIYRSSMLFLFRHHIEVHKTWLTNQVHIEALLEFEGFLSRSDEQHHEMMLSVFQDLRRCFHCFYDVEMGTEPKIRSIFTWLYRIPNEFPHLVQSGDQIALTIMAFFCVPLHRLQHIWWFQGWGLQLIERIYKALDQPHRYRIRWPIQEIGWIPKREYGQIQYDTSPMPE